MPSPRLSRRSVTSRAVRSTLGAIATCTLALAATPSATRHAEATACPPCVSMSSPRSAHAATLLPNGEVLVTGGMVRNGENLSTAELFDPRSLTFRPTGAMPGPRAGHTATRRGNGKVLVAGGYTGSSVVATALIYDSDKGTFAPTGSMS